jgi:membrane associated rhomboid family serine protease
VNFQGRKKPYLRVVGEETPDQPGHPPVINVPTAVLVSAIALIAIHVLLYVMGEGVQMWSIAEFAFSPVRTSAAYNFPNDYGQSVWTTLTYSLLHGNATHLIFNVLWLIVFGTPVGRRMPATHFFVIAAAGSVGGALATLLTQWNTFVIVIGASAAVSALMAAAVPIMFGPGSMMSRTATVERARSAPVMPFRNLLQDRSAMAYMLVFLLLTLFTGAAQRIGGAALIQESAIAWEAHLGGFAAGLLAFYALDKGPVHASRKR